jgi:hypothetical protein
MAEGSKGQKPPMKDPQDDPEQAQEGTYVQPDGPAKDRPGQVLAAQGVPAGTVIKRGDDIPSSAFEKVKGAANLVQVKEEVWEEFTPDNCITPSHRLLFTPGQVVDANAIPAYRMQPGPTFDSAQDRRDDVQVGANS